MHIAWRNIDEVPYCFSMSCIKFEGHRGKILSMLTKIYLVFPDCISSLNSPVAMEWCTKLDVEHERCHILFRGHPWNVQVTLLKMVNFERNWAFLDSDFSLNSQMATIWCTKLKVTWGKCPFVLFFRSSIKFLGHTGRKSMVFTWIERQ